MRRTSYKIVQPLLRKLDRKEVLTLDEAKLVQNSDFSRLAIVKNVLKELTPEELVAHSKGKYFGS